MNDWIKEFDAAVTVCDINGIILEMNEKANKTFEKSGGSALVGTNLMDCHPEPAREKLKEMLEHGKKNVYTIEKNGTKKLIYQSPRYVDGKLCGLVEISFEIPHDMPNFIRE